MLNTKNNIPRTSITKNITPKGPSAADAGPIPFGGLKKSERLKYRTNKKRLK